MTTSFRITAVMAILAGFPAATSCWYLAFRSGLYRNQCFQATRGCGRISSTRDAGWPLARLVGDIERGFSRIEADQTRIVPHLHQNTGPGVEMQQRPVGEPDVAPLADCGRIFLRPAAALQQRKGEGDRRGGGGHSGQKAPLRHFGVSAAEVRRIAQLRPVAIMKAFAADGFQPVGGTPGRFDLGKGDGVRVGFGDPAMDGGALARS